MEIKLSQIQADPNNPRKKFDATKLQKLIDSIKIRGIKQPLIVEDIGPGKYQLIDGERRFRAATYLKLKDVPVVVEKTANAIDRLITQFHIQEQHENWTGTEKAMALLNLSDESDMSMKELCEALALDSKTASKYLAFAKLSDKENFVKSDINLEWGLAINGLKGWVRNIKQNQLGKVYTQQDDKLLEKTIVSRIISGEFKQRTELNKLKDAFTKDPKSIEKFISDDALSAVELFNSTGAQGAYALRNIRNNAGYIVSHAKTFADIRDVKVDEATIRILKMAKESINKILAMVE